MDLSILILGASLHWREPDYSEHVDKYESFNPGLGIALHEDMAVYSAGVYHNSIDNTSVFASLGLEHTFPHGFGVSGSMMIVSGYVQNENQPIIVPVVGGFYEVGKTRLHAVFLYDGVGFFLERRF